MKRLKNVKEVMILALSLATGCSTNPYKVKEVDADVKSTHGSIQGATIAIDKNDQAIIQKENDAEVELREQTWKNYDLEKKLNYDYGQLKQCQNELADPRLGGSGQVTEIPDLDVINRLPEKKEEFGITKNGQLVMVKREMYLDRLKAERQYEEVLKSASKTVAKHKDGCEYSLSIARVKNGLPASRYAAQGHFSGEQYIQERPAEHNLDDAFRILASEKPSSKPAQEEGDE
jgi:hypothetical protein